MSELDWKYENKQWTQLPKHMRHLPLITREVSLSSRFIRALWAIFIKKIFFTFYIRIKVIGDINKILNENPKLLLISNHGSHLDAISIAAAVPVKHWIGLYAAAAKDYFFSNPFNSFFSKHCIGAIPIDRKGRRGEAIKLCIEMLTKLKKIYLIIFPEGTRTKDGKIHPFKRGVSLFSQKTNTPILFMYLEGAYELWPKGAPFAKPGVLRVHIGPVQAPANIDEINKNYKAWVESITPGVFSEKEIPEP